MAITAYTGPPGSGKSYALVADVILPALSEGRRVLSNIDGLNENLILDHLEEKFPDRHGKFGELVRFDGIEAAEEGFWPDLDVPDRPTKVQGGDLVVFDEVGIHWPVSGKFPTPVAKFLRYHRHFTCPRTHQAMDIVLATQGVTDLHRNYRPLVERTFKFKKLSTLGLNKHYAWSVWEGSTQRKGEAAINGQGTYRKEIFPLYKSYKGPGGAEASTDKRANVFRQPKVLLTIGGSVLSMIAAAWFLVSMFTAPDIASSDPAKATEGKVDAVQGAAGRSAGVSPSGASAVGDVDPFSAQWRVAGMIRIPGMQVAVLADQKGAIRYEDLSNCSMVNERPYVCTVDGQRAVSMGGAGQVSGKGGGSWIGGQ